MIELKKGVWYFFIGIYIINVIIAVDEINKMMIIL